MSAKLNWNPISHSQEAVIGVPGDGVRFSMSYYPTCYRRGPWRLLVEVFGGPAHELWGCFDDADQPTRYYHKEDCAFAEAQEIANVLWADRTKREQPIGSLHAD